MTVFPVFLFGSWLGLNNTIALLIASATGFLPHFFYAALYMTETLQFPLYLGTICCAYCWLTKPTRRNSIILGLLTSALVLNKVASWVLLVPLIVIALARLLVFWRQRDTAFHAVCVRTVIALAPPLFAQLAWIVIKLIQNGTAFGVYGVVIEQQGLTELSLGLFAAYVTDFWLAAGIVSALPTVYWLVKVRKRVPYFCAFMGSLLILQIGWLSIVEAGLTGILRERLFSFSFPVIAVIGASGFQLLRRYKTRGWLIAFCILPAALSLSALMPAFSGMAFETPWAYTLGSLKLHGIGDFSRQQLFVTTAFIAVLIPLLMVRLRTAWTEYAFAIFLIGFNLCTFMTTAILLERSTRIGVSALAPVVAWLRSSGVGNYASLVVTAPPAPFEKRSIT
ncbi:MAG: hypothetical protein KJZ78_00625, partial [Bryobacteraceae bacterium]|nr:hypothetical protein [Bryobacteraceae bacterium]